MLHKQTISSNYNQNSNKKTDENWKKKITKIELAYVHFIKQNYIEVERGVEYINYRRETAILTDF